MMAKFHPTNQIAVDMTHYDTFVKLASHAQRGSNSLIHAIRYDIGSEAVLNLMLEL